MKKQMKFKAIVKSVNTEFFVNTLPLPSGGTYNQTRQLSTCKITEFVNPYEFTPAEVEAIASVYVGLEVTGSKTLVGQKQAIESNETGIPVMKDPAKVEEEVVLYHSRVPKLDGNGFMNFWEVGSETGISNDALEEMVSKNSVLANLFAEMETA